MKLRFLQYRTNRILKKNNQQRVSVPYSTSRTAGVIFTVEDKQKHFAIKEFVRKLEQEGKSVQVLEYLPERTENYEFKFDFFQEKDVTFWGNIQSASAVQFADAPFDFLYYLDLNPNPMILNIIARSHAKCRVGRYWEEGSRYLEFMVNSAPNMQSLLDMIHKYVSHIR